MEEQLIKDQWSVPAQIIGELWNVRGFLKTFTQSVRSNHNSPKFAGGENNDYESQLFKNSP